MNIRLFKPRKDRPAPQKKYWGNQEIADFYRAVDILKQAGMNTEVDSGLTDEGDPWFVFIRPENGDVIAHFAQIDGDFVAVSSLSQEVYKGRDIRTIVDEMLKSHPLLLPQKRDGGRLFLHPTAAISAFLAAAFILNIDGIKASNIGEVLLSAAINRTEPAAAQLLSGQGENKNETQHGIFSELNALNYNVAVLGAALISQELFEPEIDPSESFELDGLSALLGSEQKDHNQEQNEIISIELASDQPLHESGSLSQNAHGSFFGSAGDVQSSNKSEEASLLATNLEKQPVKVPSVEAQLGYSAVLIDDISSSFENQKQAARSVHNNQLDNVSKTNRGSDEPNTANNSESLVVAGKASSELLNRESMDQPEINMFVETGAGESDAGDGFGLALATGGSIRIVTLDSSNFSDAFDFSNNGLVASSAMIESVEGPTLLGGVADPTYLKTENTNEGDVEIVFGGEVESLPIYGHPLSPVGQKLNLSSSDAIDVVFYTGGQAEISNFELGVDLLWFFLSPEEISSSKNTVSNTGNLVLDFGDIGTLTFLGMVAETTPETTI